MFCPECGRRVRGKAVFCPYCGAKLVPQKRSVSEVESAEPAAAEEKGTATRRRSPIGCGSSTLLVGAISLAVLIILASAALGIYQGMRERDRLDRLAANAHFTKGLEHLDKGEYELAVAELESAVRLDPNNKLAQEKLKEARGKLETAPTPTPRVVLDTAATYFSDGRALYERGLWDEAIAKLEGAIALDPSYKRQEINDLLFECYYDSGLQLANEDRMEEALLKWSRALELRPDDPNVKRQQQLASLYLAGMGYWQADWKQAVESFAALYALQPDYKDVAQRLYDAHLNYGDQLFEAQEWCLAQEQYKGALTIHDSAELRTKRDEAASRCASPPQGTGTPAPGTPAPGTPQAPSGTFVGQFVKYDPIEEHLMMVRGYVYDSGGKGMAGIQVKIAAYDWSSVAVTDGAGLFSFDGLNNPLTYTLSLVGLPSQPLDVLAEAGKLAWTEFRQTP